MKLTQVDTTFWDVYKNIAKQKMTFYVFFHLFLQIEKNKSIVLDNY